MLKMTANNAWLDDALAYDTVDTRLNLENNEYVENDSQ